MAILPMKRTLIALSVLAVVTQATFNSIESFKNRFFNKPEVKAASEWPPVHWPTDFESHGNLYTWNNETEKLEPYQNTQVNTYVDSTGNREKVVTQMDIPNIGFAEVITYIDVTNHKAYQKIPKIEKCTVSDIPASLNLTDFVHKAADPNSGITKYIGERNLTWDTQMTYYAFEIQTPDFMETVYFCRCLELK